jgi:FMN-dependent NADH-azoreductase
MDNILAINSSAALDSSASRTLVGHALDLLTDADPRAVIVRRDLDAAPIPHLTSETLAAVKGVPATDREREARSLSDELIAELRAADVIVIGAPMYNFGVPTSLRAWFDYVLRAGETFSYSETGFEGLLSGKRVIVIVSRGGLYSECPAQAVDFQEPYLRHLLSFMGITDVTVVRAEKLALGPESREHAVEVARAHLQDVVARQFLRAA